MIEHSNKRVSCVKKVLVMLISISLLVQNIYASFPLPINSKAKIVKKEEDKPKKEVVNQRLSNKIVERESRSEPTIIDNNQILIQDRVLKLTALESESKHLINSIKYVPYFEIGGAKYFNQYSNVAGIYDLFIPLLQDENKLFFSDLRVFDRSGSAFEGNIHFGYRNLLSANQQLVGVYAAFDRKRGELAWFNQVTIGGEYWHNNWFIGANWYRPIGVKERVLRKESITPITEEVNINVARNIERSSDTERALSGFDSELGYAFSDNLTGYIGGYYFTHSQAATTCGPKISFTYRHNQAIGRFLGIFDGVAIEAGIQHDKPRGTSGYLALKFKVGLTNLASNSNISGFKRHMVELVRRDPDIVLDQVRESVNQERQINFTNEDIDGLPLEILLNEFGLTKDATWDEIRAGYVEYVKLYYPYNERHGDQERFEHYSNIYRAIKRKLSYIAQEESERGILAIADVKSTANEIVNEGVGYQDMVSSSCKAHDNQEVLMVSSATGLQNIVSIMPSGRLVAGEKVYQVMVEREALTGWLSGYINKLQSGVKWIYERPKVMLTAMITGVTGFLLKKLLFKHEATNGMSRGGYDESGDIYIADDDSGDDHPSPGDFGPDRKNRDVRSGILRRLLSFAPLFFKVGSNGMSFPIFTRDWDKGITKLYEGTGIYEGTKVISESMVTSHEAKLAQQSLEKTLGVGREANSFVAPVTISDWNYDTKGKDQEEVVNRKVVLGDNSANVSKDYKVNARYEYEDRDINALLILRAQEFGFDLSKMVIIAPLSDIKLQLRTHLEEEKSRYQQAVSKGIKPYQRVVLVPLNIYNIHWVGLVIRFNEKNQLVDINYVDSLGRKMSLELVGILQDIYGKDLIIQDVPCLKQADDTGCGPLLVENLIAVARGELFSRTINEDEMSKIRRDHISLLEHFEPKLQFYFRQNRDVRSFEYETVSGERLAGGILFARLFSESFSQARTKVLPGFRLAIKGGMSEDINSRLLDDESYSQEISLAESKKNPGVISYKKAAKDIMVFSTGTVPYVFLRIAVPVVNSIFVAHLGSMESASLLLINTYNDFTGTILNSPINFAQTLIGMSNNEEDKKNVGEIAQSSWLFSILLSIPQITFVMFSKPVISKLTSDSEIISLIKKFFDLYVYALPLNSVQMASENIAFGTQKMYMPLITQACGALGYLVVGYPLIGGHWGFRALGIKGSASAFIMRGLISNIASFGVFKALSKPGRAFAPYNLFKRNIEGNGIKYHLKKLMRKGITIVLVMISEIGIMYSTNLFIGSFGRSYMSAQLVMSQYQDAIVVSSAAIATSSQTLIANNIKAARQNVAKYGKAAIGISLIVPAIYAGVCVAFPRAIISPFLNLNLPDSKPVLELLLNNKLLLISSFNNAFLAIRYVMSQALVGTGKFGASLFANMGTTWIGIVAGGVLTYIYDWNPAVGFNLGLGVGYLISSVGLTINWLNTVKNFDQGYRRLGGQLEDEMVRDMRFRNDDISELNFSTETMSIESKESKWDRFVRFLKNVFSFRIFN